MLLTVHLRGRSVVDFAITVLLSSPSGPTNGGALPPLPITGRPVPSNVAGRRRRREVDAKPSREFEQLGRPGRKSRWRTDERVPVREALRMLESEGLVELVQHSGARVAKLDYPEFSELYRLRELLDPMLLAASVPVLSDEQVAHLAALADKIASAGHDISAWIDLDRRFHVESYVAESMPQTFRLVRDLWSRTQQYRRGFVAALDDDALEVINMEHRLIVDAITRRDPEGAAERLRLHIRRTRLGLADRQELFHGVAS